MLRVLKLCLLLTLYNLPAAATGFGCAHEVPDLLALGSYINEQINANHPSNGKLVTELYNRPELQRQFANIAPLCIDSLEQQQKSGKFQLKLSGTNKDTGSLVSYNVHGNYQYMLAIPVAKHPIKRGEPIASDDLTTIEINEQKLLKDTILYEKELVGQTSRSSIASHQPINHSQVSGSLLVQKNHPATLQYEHGGVLIRVAGKALNDASNGELARVRNAKSGTIVEGIAVGPNLVRVGE